VLKLGGSWNDTTVALPSGRWHNAFTGETLKGGDLRVANLLRRFPVALLSREDGS
jgi:(1->4)-alpha-D-glucan 1-alpha-D-glucosylmutase